MHEIHGAASGCMRRLRSVFPASSNKRTRCLDRTGLEAEIPRHPPQLVEEPIEFG